MRQCRRSERFLVDLPVKIDTALSDRPFSEKTRNLSSGGAFVTSRARVFVGEPVVCTLHVPSDDWNYSFFSRVVHVVRSGEGIDGFGVEFLTAIIPQKKSVQDLLVSLYSEATVDDGAHAGRRLLKRPFWKKLSRQLLLKRALH